MLKKTREIRVTGGRIETTIGGKTSVTGRIQVDGNLRVDGVVEGSMQIVGNLIVSREATVKADITAHSVQVWGSVEGSIVASEKLEILRTGRVFADVEVSALLIDDDAVFRGKCVIRGDQAPSEPEDEAPDPEEQTRAE